MGKRGGMEMNRCVGVVTKGEGEHKKQMADE